ncbi:hypothetical protein Tco_0403958 [Tanacetum coccineum]
MEKLQLLLLLRLTNNWTSKRGIKKEFKKHLLLAIPNETILKFSQMLADANHSWEAIKSRKRNQIALIMRNKPDIDEIDIDDLYNNLRVYEDEMKRSSSSTSTSQNLAFLSSENTSSTNEVSTASGDFRVSTAGGISQVSSTPCAHDDRRALLWLQPTTRPALRKLGFFTKRLMQMTFKKLDLRWQVAMLTVRVRKFI